MLRPTYAMSVPTDPTPGPPVPPGPSGKIPADLIDDVFDIIASVYGSAARRSLLCRDAQVTTRTGQHWIQRSYAPRISHLFNMMAARPEFKKAIQALIERL